MAEHLVFSTPDQIRAYQLLAVRSAIRLQKQGFGHSSGRSVKAMWAKHYGLSPRASFDEVITKIEDELNVLKKRIWDHAHPETAN